jgi:hypothetical protein
MVEEPVEEGASLFSLPNVRPIATSSTTFSTWARAVVGRAGAAVMRPGRPAADECLPYYFQYIDLVPDGHIVELLERQITETAAYLAAFTPEQASRREAPAPIARLPLRPPARRMRRSL